MFGKLHGTFLYSQRQQLGNPEYTTRFQKLCMTAVAVGEIGMKILYIYFIVLLKQYIFNKKYIWYLYKLRNIQKQIISLGYSGPLAQVESPLAMRFFAEQKSLDTFTASWRQLLRDSNCFSYFSTGTSNIVPTCSNRNGSDMFRSIWATSRNRVVSVISPWPDLSIVRDKKLKDHRPTPHDSPFLHFSS